MSTETNNENTLPLRAQIESLLFVAIEPVPLSRLANVLDTSKKNIISGLQDLQADYQTRGLRLQWWDNLVQLTSAPENSQIVERFLGLELPTTKLSQAALEVLAITA